MLPAELRGKVAAAGQFVCFELDLELLERPQSKSAQYPPIPAVPGSRQDFPVLWSTGRPYSELEETIAAFRHPLFARWQLVDVFEGVPLPEDHASYTIRFWLQTTPAHPRQRRHHAFRSALVAHLQRQGMSLR